MSLWRGSCRVGHMADKRDPIESTSYIAMNVECVSDNGKCCVDSNDWYIFHCLNRTHRTNLSASLYGPAESVMSRCIWEELYTNYIPNIAKPIGQGGRATIATNVEEKDRRVERRPSYSSEITAWSLAQGQGRSHYDTQMQIVQSMALRCGLPKETSFV